MCDSIRSASLYINRPRSRASILRQGPESNALRAALTARSMSAASPSATWAITSSVAGLIVSNVLPLLLSRHLPSMSILVWCDWAILRRGLVAVAIGRSPCCRARAILALVPFVPCEPWRHLMTDRCRHSSGGPICRAMSFLILIFNFFRFSHWLSTIRCVAMVVVICQITTMDGESLGDSSGLLSFVRTSDAVSSRPGLAYISGTPSVGMRAGDTRSSPVSGPHRLPQGEAT